MNSKVAVLGGGSWATAIVKMLTENISNVGWYIRDEQIIEHIRENDHNPKYLRSAELKAEQLEITSDINNLKFKLSLSCHCIT